MQFLVTARDGSDDKAAERRQTARAAHLEVCVRMKEAGTMLFGAALLDEANKMIGSIIVLDLPSREHVDAYLKDEPYVKGNVWQNIEVTPCGVGQMFMPSCKT